MKNSIFVLFAVVAAMFTTSCNKNETASVQTLVPVIATTSFTDGIIITEANTGQQFNFYWTKAMFEDKAAATYTIQIDSVNGSFKNPVTLISTTELKAISTLGELNTKLNAYGIKACERKNIKFRVFASSGASTFASIAKEFAVTLFSVNQKHPVLSSASSSTGLVISKDNSNSTIDFTWTAASFGVNTTVTYALQVDANADFSNPTVLDGNLTGTSKSINIGNLNKQLLSKGFNPAVKVNLNFRIVASAPVANFTLNSATLPIDITPMKGDLYIYTAPSWDPTSARLLNGALDGLKYEHYMYVDAWGNFKLLPSNTSISGEIGGWNSGDRNHDGYGDITSGDHWSMWVPGTSGVYYFLFDLSKMNYTSILVESLSIVGEPAGGWGKSVGMTYDKTTETWSVKADLLAGNFKILFNNFDWEHCLVYADASHVKTGIGGDGNLSIPTAGNYTVSVNLKSYPYTYSAVKN